MNQEVVIDVNDLLAGCDTGKIELQTWRHIRWLLVELPLLVIYCCDKFVCCLMSLKIWSHLKFSFDAMYNILSIYDSMSFFIVHSKILLLFLFFGMNCPKVLRDFTILTFCILKEALLLLLMLFY